MIRSEVSMFNQRPHKAVGRLLKTFDADVLNAAGLHAHWIESKTNRFW